MSSQLLALAIGAILTAITVWELRSGKTVAHFVTVSRADSPVFYWFVIAVRMVLIAGALLGAMGVVSI